MAAEPAGGHPGVSRRLERMGRWIRRCPRGLADAAFAAAAIGDAVLRSGRHARARAWARARGLQGLACERVALGLLANHGRFVVDELVLPLMSDAEIAERMLVEGRPHLDGLAGGGAILLVFHLGPPGAWRALRARGYRIHASVRSRTVLQRDASSALDDGSMIGFDDGDATTRVSALFRMRRLLADGALVVLAADGPFGHEAFRFDVDGAPLLIRRGWIALRRSLQVPVLPVLTHRGDGGRSTVCVHAPLPPVIADEQADLAACRDAIAPLVRDYSARYPTQCRWLAMPHWSTAVAADAHAGSVS